ncbi:MAG: hypothetical protein A2W80_04280 [Candidatus Riflebacteria bacterium GWC2_50_8]|nr:MAG: hypothetical protein A2W80_04280 [Candidatus Riflebacteria bacterium GWC2_50_8]
MAAPIPKTLLGASGLGSVFTVISPCAPLEYSIPPHPQPCIKNTKARKAKTINKEIAILE